MNTTITSPTFNSNWKRFKGQYVATVCGLALAASALTGVGSGGNSGTAGTTVPASRASISLVVPQRGPSQHTIVVASSEQQVIDQRASLFQDIDLSWYGAYTFIVASSPAEEAQAQSFIREALSEVSGVSIQVLDLRSAPTAGPATSAVVAFESSISGSTSVAPRRAQAVLDTYTMPAQPTLIPAADAAEEAARSLIPEAQLGRP